jgi:hypothetical protein
MPRLNTTQLVLQVADVGFRVDQVQRDPAVRKSWADAWDDAVRAGCSTKLALAETLSAWHRTERGHAVAAAPAAT